MLDVVVLLGHEDTLCDRSQSRYQKRRREGRMSHTAEEVLVDELTVGLGDKPKALLVEFK